MGWGSCRNEVYPSNRSAALMAVGRHQEALADGRKVVELKPSWVKGYARVGAAFFVLEQFTEVRGLQVKSPCCLLQHLPPGKICCMPSLFSEF